MVSTSEPFIIPVDAWINVPLEDVHYSGTFYAMVHWDATTGRTNSIGIDIDGPNANENLDYMIKNDVWHLAHDYMIMQGLPPCVFMIRANAFVEAKSVSYGGNVSFVEEADSKVKTLNSNDFSFEKSGISVNVEESYVPVHARTVDNSKSFEGYAVYKLLKGASETEWTELSSTIPGTTHTYDYDMTSDRSLVANFIKTYNVSVVSGNLDYGTVSGGGVNIVHGSSITIKATAKTGYKFINWTKTGGTEFSKDAEHTFNVTENLELTANFGEVGINVEQISSFTIYPNPAKDILTIVRSTSNKARVEIYTTNGSIVKSLEITQTKSVIDVSSLPTGVYMIRLIEEKNVVTKRIVIN